MKSLRKNYLSRIGMVFIALVLIGAITQIVFTEDKLSEKDKIIIKLKDEDTLANEAKRIKEDRQVQIEALIYVITDIQKGLAEGRPSLRTPPAEMSVQLLGDIRAVESVNTLIDLGCFLIDERTPSISLSTDRDMALRGLESSTEKALSKIGKPAVPELIELIKNGTTRTHFAAGVTNEGKRLIQANDNSNAKKNYFFREMLYLIEDDCAVHRLEKALKEEKDETKKKNLSDAITKFKEELKSGAFNK
ncbi:MAG: hypothetical protein HY811_09720 [Planctomycetes bacterium]|nr:hypothetical protein [Planctomycetota bacterium]